MVYSPSRPCDSPARPSVGTIAAVVALVVAIKTKNTIATLVAGMVTLWLAQWANGLL